MKPNKSLVFLCTILFTLLPFLLNGSASAQVAVPPPPPDFLRALIQSLMGEEVKVSWDCIPGSQPGNERVTLSVRVSSQKAISIVSPIMTNAFESFGSFYRYFKTWDNMPCPDFQKVLEEFSYVQAQADLGKGPWLSPELQAAEVQVTNRSFTFSLGKLPPWFLPGAVGLLLLIVVFAAFRRAT